MKRESRRFGIQSGVTSITIYRTKATNQKRKKEWAKAMQEFTQPNQKQDRETERQRVKALWEEREEGVTLFCFIIWDYRGVGEAGQRRAGCEFFFILSCANLGVLFSILFVQ